MFSITPFGWFWILCSFVFIFFYKIYTKKTIFDIWLLGSILFGPILLFAVGIMFSLRFYFDKKGYPNWILRREKITGINVIAEISFSISILISAIVMIIISHFVLKVI